MRIWYLHDSRLPGEAANTVQVMKMCAAFAEAGAKVRLLARLGPAGVTDGLFREYAVPRSFEIAPAPRLVPGRSGRDRWNVPFSVSAWWALRRKRDEFDLLYTRIPLLAELADAAGIPVAFEAHRRLPEGGWFAGKFRRRFASVASRPNFRVLVTISRVLNDWYRERGFPEAKLLIEHDGVDLERFTPALSTAEARQQTGLPLDRPIIGYAGHLYAGRGIEELLQCASRMPEALFLFAGGSPGDVERHRADAQRQNLSNVVFTGFVQNAALAPWLFSADVLAMPYNARTGSAPFMSPMKMFEYMAAGRTVVATRWPSVEEILEDGRNAVLVPPDDVPALEAGLRRGLAEARTGTIAAAARRDVEAHTWRSRAEEILRFIRCGERPPARTVSQEPGKSSQRDDATDVESSVPRRRFLARERARKPPATLPGRVFPGTTWAAVP